ncbi:MAG: hypothetical protein GY930_18370 [bacterium]|nr:hypothetical protein [bacterium]
MISPTNESSPDRLRPTAKQLRILALIIVIGTILRAIPIMWSSAFLNPTQYNFHPDEPKIVRSADDFPDFLTEYHDYRYPHFLHTTYGVAWWAVGGALDLRDDTASLPGGPSYERALIFTRALNILLYGLGAMWLLWLFGKRMFDPCAALFIVAASSIQGWVVASTALVQTDVPSAYALLGLFYLLLRIDRSEVIRPRQGWLVGVVMGVSIAIKYTTAIGWLAIGISILAGVRRRAFTASQASGFLALATLSCILTFIIFVPGSTYDFSSFYGSIEWEYDNKMKAAKFSTAGFLEGLFTCLPLWIMVPAGIGVALSLFAQRSLTAASILVCMAIYMLISARAFRPDYAVTLMPFAAVFSGYALWKLASFKPIGLKVALLYLILGHIFVGWTVCQRYVGDTRYAFDAWARDNIEPGPLGDGPTAMFGRYAAPSAPEGYKFVPVYDHPEWLVLCKRHYELFENTIEDPNFYERAGSIVEDPNNRELGLFKERDYLFYEDVLLGMGREFKYDLVQKFRMSDLPLDMQGNDVLVYRRMQR